jgi:hypothetical protein
VAHLEGYEQVVEELRTPKEDIDEDSGMRSLAVKRFASPSSTCCGHSRRSLREASLMEVS